MRAVSVNQALAVGFSLEDLKGEIKSMLSERHWRKFDLADTVLLYTPHYVFRFITYTEQAPEKGRDKIVSETRQGCLALNALTGELSDDEAFAQTLATTKLAPFFELQGKEEFEVDIQKPVLTSRAAEKTSRLKTAEFAQVPQKNVEVFDLRLVYLPSWTVSISLPDGDFELEYSAVDGTVLSEDEIPERTKGKTELAGETLSELTVPAKWLEYASGIAKDIYESVHLRAIGKFFVHDNRGRAIFVIIIILIIIRLLVFPYA